MMLKIKYLAVLLLATTFVMSCGDAAKNSNTLDADNLEESLQEKLITAEDGAVINLPEGTFELKRPISLNDVPNVTIKGAGKGKTILSFKGQIEGAEGLIIKAADGLTLEDFTIADTKGDAIKVQNCKDVVMRGLETTWTGGPKESNGGYGLYPVMCTNVLMENCEASYASDAGIYVGQSNNVVVRNNYAHHNVAGIEIENTRDADVYENKTVNNTGGLLIFDMPDLPQANGYNIKVHNNVVEDNNHPNFAPKGTVVNILPSGTGFLVMAHKDIEIYDNIIKKHKTAAVSITSWILTGRPFKSKEYDPFCSNIYVHDNKISETQGPTDTQTEFGQLITGVLSGEAKDILIDGIFNPEGGNPNICFQNNGEVTFANFNAGQGPSPEEIMKNVSDDMTNFSCEGTSITLSN